MQLEIWIGTIEISYTDPETGKRGNAFTNVTTWAASPMEFREKCERMLGDYGWHLLEVDRCNPVPEYGEFNDEVADMIERTRINANAIIYGTFHDYPVM